MTRKNTRTRTVTAAETVEERDDVYGGFEVVSEFSQRLSDVLRDSPNWDIMPPHQKEALEMIMHKTARIVCGDPDHRDSWHDIQGYGLLAEKLLAD